MAIKLGIHTGQQDCTYEELRRVWRLADSSGFYWVSIWDHFYENPTVDGKGDCFEGISIMTALAAETENVRVGSLVFGMGYRHPAVLAKAAVTVDHVSNGRLELGVGAGWYELEHDAFGITFPPVATRMDILEEGVQVIKSMLNNEVTNFQGKHFQLTDANCFPRPVQKPPRVWVGGRGERRTLRIAARYADGWNNTPASVKHCRTMLEMLRKACERTDRDYGSIKKSLETQILIAPTRSEVERLKDQISEANPATYDDKAWKQADEHYLIGDPEAVSARISEYASLGIDHMQLWFMDMPSQEGMRIFAERVAPGFA